MKSFLVLLNLIQFAVILGLTNPSEYRHVEFITERAQQELQTDQSILNKLLGAARTVGNLDADYQSYYLVSVMRKNGQPVTIGALGHIWWADDLPEGVTALFRLH